MEIGSKKHDRHSIRLQGYDYSQAGAYFITVCTHQRACLFGEIDGGAMRLNEVGGVVEECWLAIPHHFPRAQLDAFVVMPNHVHGIIVIAEGPVGAKNFSPLHEFNNPVSRPTGALSKSIGSIVRGFKIGVTKWFRDHGRATMVWQRNYYEHVIRNEESLNRIRQYIVDNPAKWEFDRENPMAAKPEPKDRWLN